MFETALIIFWACVLMLGYTYVGYPALIWAAARIRPRRVAMAEIEPAVSIIITAFNEEKAIEAKLQNTFEIDYPSQKLEIIVASDGSTDRTDEIVADHAVRGVRLFRQEGRVGKTVTQNNAVAAAKGDVILFSDATTHYHSSALRRLVPVFADETVGCAAGRLEYVANPASSVGSGVKGYWGYETLIKTAESEACSLIGASGCLYAVRRSAYKPMYAEACSDFLICTELFRAGLRSVFIPEAVCFEEANGNASDEFRMRVRVISQTFTDLWRNRDIMNPFKYGLYSVQMFSHKLLRYAVPLLLLGMLAASLMLASVSTYFAWIVWAQIAFYAAAVFGWALDRGGRRLSVLSIPMYFVLANTASIFAFYRFMKGERIATWEPIR